MGLAALANPVFISYDWVEIHVSEDNRRDAEALSLIQGIIINGRVIEIVHYILGVSAVRLFASSNNYIQIQR